MIKCPECGHQVSDRAPYCPSCGVEIAGHIVKCANCGEIHLKEDLTCPNCHYSQVGSEPSEAIATVLEEPVVVPEKSTPVREEYVPVREERQSTPERKAPRRETERKQQTVAKPQEPIQQAVPISSEDDKEEKRKSSFGPLLIAFLITAIVCAVMLYMYRDAQTGNEVKLYELAIKSTEPSVLQQYLDKYHDTNKAHATEVRNKLSYLLQQQNQKAEKPEQTVEEDTSDDADWQVAVEEDSEDSYARYKVQHPEGKHGAEADEALKKFARATIVTDEDESRAMNAVRTVLRAINGRSKDKLTSQFAESINYNGQDGETSQAVVDYMEHLYNNVDRLNWYLDRGEPSVTKAENQELTITVPARLSQNLKSGANAQNHFNLRATLNTDGRIKAITFTKLAQPVEKKE